jgi:hypothetical protein
MKKPMPEAGRQLLSRTAAEVREEQTDTRQIQAAEFSTQAY